MRDAHRPARARRRLARPEDAAPLFFSCTVGVAWLAAFAIALFPTHAGIVSMAGAVAFLLGAGFLLGLLGGLNVVSVLHAHVHRPLLRSPRANAWLARLTALSAGWPAFLWAHMHREHHAHVQTDADWTAPRRRRDGRTESLLAFGFVLWPLRVFRALKADLEAGRLGEPAAVRRELVLFACLWCAPALLGPWILIGLWVLPHLVANLVVLATFAYVVPLGGRGGSEARSLTLANSFESPLFDTLAFHVGLASVHYAWPQAHWSTLPALHERERERMIEEGTHVLPYGPFQASEVLGGFLGVAGAQREFAETQARDYGTPLALRAPEAAAATARAA